MLIGALSQFEESAPNSSLMTPVALVELGSTAIAVPVVCVMVATKYPMMKVVLFMVISPESGVDNTDDDRKAIDLPMPSTRRDASAILDKVSQP